MVFWRVLLFLQSEKSIQAFHATYAVFSTTFAKVHMMDQRFLFTQNYGIGSTIMETRTLNNLLTTTVELSARKQEVPHLESLQVPMIPSTICQLSRLVDLDALQA